jgi:hypothetical protein
MSEKLQLKGGISEPGLDIPPNWKDIRTSIYFVSVFVLLYGLLMEGG